MSENCRYYREKMAAKRWQGSERLREQLWDLMEVVRRCEHMWALEDRIERQL